jgi:hypothetical protein
MRPIPRRRSRARPRPLSRAKLTTVGSWLDRWERQRELQDQGLARSAANESTPDLAAHGSQIAIVAAVAAIGLFVYGMLEVRAAVVLLATNG